VALRSDSPQNFWLSLITLISLFEKDEFSVHDLLFDEKYTIFALISLSNLDANRGNLKIRPDLTRENNDGEPSYQHFHPPHFLADPREPLETRKLSMRSDSQVWNLHRGSSSPSHSPSSIPLNRSVP
jgi:hypothetical protein